MSEDRDGGSERRLKKYTVLISAVALTASFASAFAAVMSWRTASASLELARSVADKSGARLEVDGTIYLRGDCDDPGKPPVATIGVRNVGHLSGSVIQLILNLYASPDGGSRFPQVMGLTSHNLRVYIDPQDQAYVDAPLICSNLQQFGLAVPDTLSKVRQSVSDNSNTWTVLPTYAVMDQAEQYVSYRIRSAIPRPNG
jgi:hypothetical protein